VTQNRTSVSCNDPVDEVALRSIVVGLGKDVKKSDILTSCRKVVNAQPKKMSDQ